MNVAMNSNNGGKNSLKKLTKLSKGLSGNQKSSKNLDLNKI
jgi:hypothetical protein